MLKYSRNHKNTHFHTIQLPSLQRPTLLGCWMQIAHLVVEVWPLLGRTLPIHSGSIHSKVIKLHIFKNSIQIYFETTWDLPPLGLGTADHSQRPTLMTLNRTVTESRHRKPSQINQNWKDTIYPSCPGTSEWTALNSFYTEACPRHFEHLSVYCVSGIILNAGDIQTR